MVWLQYDWYTKQTSVVVDVVQRAREGMCMHSCFSFVGKELIKTVIQMKISGLFNLSLCLSTLCVCVCQMVLLGSTAQCFLPTAGQLTVSVCLFPVLRDAARYCNTSLTLELHS